MRDRMEKFVLLPFSAGCISESSIAVAQQQAKRSNLDTKLTPSREKEEEEVEHDDEEDEESLSGDNLKSPLSHLALHRFQKLFKNFKNFSQSFAYKDELEETDMGIEIGFPTDVKHVTHIGLDGCASSILSKGWTNEPEQTINLPSFPLTPLELAMSKHTPNKPTFQSLLETK
ncbi:ROP-interactive CRIB motif-containing protein 4 [Striga asiatica]|uniref:ROP-interactive CRIB motif-containing protein 4 n=1 Tax=Striga asiatica TaxID=4170 RepID=A0A5A7P664_STRAF|nr:ROP-interactive CRIB motif-containing protein 4 [Striga asiatica]